MTSETDIDRDDNVQVSASTEDVTAEGTPEDEELLLEDQEPVSQTAEDVLQNRVNELESEVADFKDKYLRALAETENLRKRNVKERSELIKYAGENLARDLIEVVDLLEMALSQQRVEAESGPFVEGVSMVLDKFQGILLNHSIKSKETLGDKFDPVKQEALAIVENSSVADGTVLEEFKKPYYYRDKLLRPGQVVVSKVPLAVDGDEEMNGE